MIVREGTQVTRVALTRGVGAPHSEDDEDDHSRVGCHLFV